MVVVEVPDFSFFRRWRFVVALAFAGTVGLLPSGAAVSASAEAAASVSAGETVSALTGVTASPFVGEVVAESATAEGVSESGLLKSGPSCVRVVASPDLYNAKRALISRHKAESFL